MTTITLPPLPEPCRNAAVTNFQGASEYRSLSSDYETHTARFSVDQLRARDLAVAQAVREACIEVVIEQCSGEISRLIAAIRAIKIEGETR